MTAAPDIFLSYNREDQPVAKHHRRDYGLVSDQRFLFEFTPAAVCFRNQNGSSNLGSKP